MTGAAPETPAPGWAVLIGLLFTAIGGGTGVTALLLFVTQGRKLKADTAKVLTDAAVAMVEPMEKRLAAAEARTGEIERRLDDEERAHSRTRSRLRRVEHQLSTLILAIMDPHASIESLRRLVVAQAGRRGNPQ